MPHADFVHLRVHSAYSLSEGAIKVKELVKLCVGQAMPAVAIVDTGNLFGALEFAGAAAEAGVQPIIGCQLGLRRTDGGGRHNSLPGVAPPPDQLVLLVQNEAGYRNLLALVSRAFLETESHESPQIALDDLADATDGLIALTGGPAGMVGRPLGEGQRPAAEAALDRLAQLFPGRLYIELMRHGLAVEDRIEAALVDLAYARDLPLVATNDVFFANAGMYEAHDVLLCIADGKTLSDGERRRLTPEHRFKSAAEMRALFADLPEAIDNTLVVARRCAYMPVARKPILPAFRTESGRDETAELREAAAAGLERRLASQVYREGQDEAARAEVAGPYRERLEYELGVISSMGFAGYFLIVADFIQWAKAQGIPVGPGRGSGAGSVVAWSLTITDLDPIRFGLLFERFLNPERISMPDFDIDFCQERRDEVIRYVQQRYGADRVAQIITFGKLQARAVLRDVGRVLEMPYGQVDRICKLVPNNPANPVTLDKAIDGEPQLQQWRDTDEAVARLLSIGLKLEGLYRHASTHAAGLVIGDRPLDELVPLYRDPRSTMPVTQFNMKFVELAGLVKFDFLGLKTLTVLARAEALIRASGQAIDVMNPPLEDAATYEMLSRGDAMGVFQFESSGMRDLLREAKPQNIEDLIALVALYRPGPMENIPKYIACKHGREKPEFMHETIDPVVKDTYGVIIYQEQVLQIAQVFAGYTLGAADLLRRAMGKKIKEEMEAQRDTFVKGAMARGVSAERASYVFDLVDKFAGYGFNKAHSACYAFIAYQTAWLKANYPVEFFAASMTLDLGNTDKLNVFRQELQRLKVPLLPPDINRSEPHFSVETLPDGGKAVRYALAAVKNVGAHAMEVVIAERQSGGPFASLFDFARRLDTRVVNKRQLENLAAAGAFDGLNPHRAQVYAAVEMLIRHAGSAAAERESNQVNLFGEVSVDDMPLPVVADWEPNDRLRREFEAIGFYLSAHPLDDYARALARLGVVKQAELTNRVVDGSTRAKLAGIVISKQERTSARGNRFAFVQMSDTSGVFEVTLFAEVLAASRPLLESGKPLLITAEVRSEGDGVRILAQSLTPLDAAAADAAASLRIYLKDDAPIASLRKLFDGAAVPRAKGRVSLIVDIDDREVEIALPGHFPVSPQMKARAKAIPGVVDVQEL
ncbi:MAG TPA: DNA polymerase III subunit alpha [Candidatus Sulfotelmatobacter sp.]|nr:DNA polymerase III subunit alpha [Candidatus Sulfotelmatobacter sp.]